MPNTSVDAPIGIFDSGLGGLSVLQAIRTQLPNENLLYCADSAYAPYGDKPDSYVEQRSICIGAWLLERGAKTIVVACNTATALAARTLRERYPHLPIVGIEPGLKPALEVTRNGVVGVLATTSTLASERYARLLQQVQRLAERQVRFISQPGLGWVECVEQGQLQGAEVEQRVQAALQPLLAQGVDTLVLGCTHYPFLLPLIERFAPGLAVVDTAPAVARQLEKRLRDTIALRQETAPAFIQLTTTANVVDMQTVVQRLFKATEIDYLASKNCSFSVEPCNAVVEECSPSIVCVTKSK